MVQCTDISAVKLQGPAIMIWAGGVDIKVHVCRVGKYRAVALRMYFVRVAVERKFR